MAKVLLQQGLLGDKHYDLSKLQVKKQLRADFDPSEASRVLQHILEDLDVRVDGVEKGI